MIINAELRRNLWLEFSAQRLIVTPILIAAILILSYLSNDSLDDVQTCSYFISIFYIYLWGTKSASESIPDELNDRTWDIQRLSVLTPWSLSWGKLLGSTSYAWYGAILALTPFSILYSNTNGFHSLLLQRFILILGGVFAHALALLLSMNALQKEKGSRIKTYGYFLVALLISFQYTSAALSSILVEQAKPLKDAFAMPHNAFDPVYWYGHKISFSAATIGGLCIMFSWTLIALYRSMRQALQYHNLPWVWFLFTAFSIIYFPGFYSELELASSIKALQITQKDLIDFIYRSPTYLSFFYAIALCYFALFSEKINCVTYQQLRKKTLLRKPIPRWLVSFPFVLLTGAWIASTSNPIYIDSLTINFVPSIFVMASILFIIRDTLIIHYCKFSPSFKRAIPAAILYLFVLYLLAPLLLLVSDGNTATGLFWPGTSRSTAVSLLGPALQVALMTYLVWRRWNEVNSLNK